MSGGHGGLEQLPGRAGGLHQLIMHCLHMHDCVLGSSHGHESVRVDKAGAQPLRHIEDAASVIGESAESLCSPIRCCRTFAQHKSALEAPCKLCSKIYITHHEPQ